MAKCRWSFLGGDFRGVVVNHEGGLQGSNDTEALHAQCAPGAEWIGTGGGSPITNVSIFEGTGYNDIFYAPGARFNLAKEDTMAAPFTHDGLELPGGVHMGVSGANVYFASPHDSRFIGGDGYDLVNFDFNYHRYQALGRTGISNVEIDLNTEVATTGNGRGGPVPRITCAISTVSSAPSEPTSSAAMTRAFSFTVAAGAVTAFMAAPAMM